MEIVETSLSFGADGFAPLMGRKGPYAKIAYNIQCRPEYLLA